VVLIEGLLGKGGLGGIGELLYKLLVALFSRLIMEILLD